MPPITTGPYIGGPSNPGGLAGSPRLPMPFNGSPKVPVSRFGQPPVPTPAPATPTPANTLPAQTVRPTGPSQGFDPGYLQNLATAIGGLFSRPQGNLSFNPLGNLSDVASPGLGFGNAALPGLPLTLLQDAINNLAFIFNQPPASTGGGGGSTVGGGGGNNNRPGRGGYPIALQ